MCFLTKSMLEYKCKTQRKFTPKDVMRKAIKKVLVDKTFCRTVANKYDIDISHVTLQTYRFNYYKEAVIVKMI